MTLLDLEVSYIIIFVLFNNKQYISSVFSVFALV